MRPTHPLILLLAAALIAGCTGPDSEGTSAESLTLLAHESFAAGVTDETFAAFTADTGVTVEVVAGDDAGSTVNQAILTRDNPIADVLFGIDDTFLSRALDEDLFVPYESTLLERVLPGLDIDPEHRVTPIDYGDVCMNYDIAWFVDNGLEPPETLEDLAAPEYAGLLVVEDPASSSPGLAFLLATVVRFGQEWPSYWESLVANDVNIVSDWDTAYYAEFTRYGGSDPVVLSYASSPPAEVMFAEEPLETAPTGVITDGCYRQIEFAGILEGTDHPQEAASLIDFLLSEEFQATIPETWFVFPANVDAALPAVFADNTVIPADPIQMAPGEIAGNRDDWIDQWRQIVSP